MYAHTFPLITISGEAFDLGRQHGEILREEIAQSIKFYRSIFKLSDEKIFRHASYFEKLIEGFNPAYLEEINGIAEGAGVDSQWIYALNARTEILSHSGYVSQECTSVYFPQESILGQTWDWGKALEPLTVLMNIQRPDGHIISMMTEPGIIGKIGMNNAGLGVCLNILTLGKILDGLPVHLILRAILDCQSLTQVNRLLERFSHGKASNIIVADANSNGFNIEFNGVYHHRIEPEEDALVHTNHYLGEDINSEHDELFYSSYSRHRTASQFLARKSDRDIETMCHLLSDESHQAFPIYRDFLPDESVQELGTVCSIAMDLAKQRMRVRKGKNANAGFVGYRMTDVGLELAS